MSRVQKARKRTTVARNALFVEARRAIPVVTTPSNAIKRGRKLTSTEQILKDETFERRIERALLQHQPPFVRNEIQRFHQEIDASFSLMDTGHLDPSSITSQDVDMPMANLSDSEYEDEDEYDEALMQLSTQTSSIYVPHLARRKVARRTFTGLLRDSIKQWSDQETDCGKAYLEWKHGRRDENNTQYSNATEYFELPTIGFDGYEASRRFGAVSGHRNVSLIRQGFIGTQPTNPRLAVSLRTLEIYVIARRHCPTFSIEKFAKTLCSISLIRYTPGLRRLIYNAMDYFLSLQRFIEKQVADASGVDSLNARLKMTCPACFHQVPGEPSMKYSVIISLDGNESQRRDSKNQADPRTFEASYYVSEQEVNRFQYDVQTQRTTKSSVALGSGTETVGAPETNEDSGTFDNSACTKNWTAAKSDNTKSMFNTFDETGIFTAVCRHGHVLLVADMIQSGERAKYPLALISKLLETGTERILMAYDIGCTFRKTVAGSQIGELAKRLKMDYIIPAFHAWSHNRHCQLTHHPIYREGTGIEDMEGCERLFSWTNTGARSLRHTSKFHRRQGLDLLFSQWNEDKYGNIGQFILNNYRQALQIIDRNEQLLAGLEASSPLDVNRAEFPHLLREEQQYLESRHERTKEDDRDVEYLERLLKLRIAEEVARSSTALLAAATTQKDRTELRRIQRQSHDLYIAQLKDVNSFERIEGYEERWDCNSAIWIETSKKLHESRYISAAEELCKLVVQRLLELEKLGAGATGYKLRKSLTKAITRRSAAIRTALQRYNEEAAKLTPPRPALTFAEVASHEFIADFELLREGRDDIRQKKWANPAVREGVKWWLKILRAKEEIVRLNIESLRLKAWICESNVQRESQIASLHSTYPSLSKELAYRHHRQLKCDLDITLKLWEMEELTGFTGRVITEEFISARDTFSALWKSLIGQDEVEICDFSTSSSRLHVAGDGEEGDGSESAAGILVDEDEMLIETLESFVDRI